MDEQDTIVSTRETLEQDMGRTILRGVRGGEDSTARFVVPVGTEEVDVKMSLKPPRPAERSNGSEPAR